MRRRKLIGALAGAAVLLLMAGAFVAWPQPDRITRKNCNRITKGMSRAEVYAILGPPGDYRTVPTEKEPALPQETSLRQAKIEAPLPARLRSMHTLDWHGDMGDISVLIYPEIVLDKDFQDTERIEQTTIENFLWRAKRLWRKWFPEK